MSKSGLKLKLPGGARRPDPDGLRRLLLRPDDHQSLMRIALSLGAAVSLDELLGKVLDAAREAFSVAGASILLLDATTRKLRFAAVAGGHEDELRSVELDLGEGVAGWVALHGQPLIVDDAYAEPRFSAKGDSATGIRTDNILCVPLRTPQRTVLGTLELVNRLRDFDLNDVQLCLSIANIAAVAIENVQLRNEAELRLAHLEESRRSHVDFVNVLSHEFRTPLTVITTGLSILGSLTAKDPVAAETLAAMKWNTARLKTLVTDIFIVNHADELKERLVRYPTNLADLVRNVARSFEDRESQLKLHVTVPENVEADSLTRMLDRGKIAHCIEHLLDNAHKFSTPEAPIDLVLEPDKPDGAWRITVRDCGVGIPDECGERVFDLFYQVDGSATRKYGGTGLGLYICRRIVEAHGGTIHYRSGLLAGSEFWFVLPPPQ